MAFLAEGVAKGVRRNLPASVAGLLLDDRDDGQGDRVDGEQDAGEQQQEIERIARFGGLCHADSSHGDGRIASSVVHCSGRGLQSDALGNRQSVCTGAARSIT